MFYQQAVYQRDDKGETGVEMLSTLMGVFGMVKLVCSTFCAFKIGRCSNYGQDEILTDDKNVNLCVKDQQERGNCQTSTTVPNPFADGQSTEICKSKFEKQSSSGTGIVEAAGPTSDYELAQYPGQNLIPSTEAYQPTTNTEEPTDPASVQEENPSGYDKDLAFLDTTAPVNEQTSALDADTSTYYRRIKRGLSGRVFKA